MQRFGEKLRRLRKQRGITAQELALALGLAHRSHISNIESGRKRPSLDFVLNVAKFFDVSVDQLVKDELELDE